MTRSKIRLDKSWGFINVAVIIIAFYLNPILVANKKRVLFHQENFEDGSLCWLKKDKMADPARDHLWVIIRKFRIDVP